MALRWCLWGKFHMARKNMDLLWQWSHNITFFHIVYQFHHLFLTRIHWMDPLIFISSQHFPFPLITPFDFYLFLLLQFNVNDFHCHICWLYIPYIKLNFIYRAKCGKFKTENKSKRQPRKVAFSLNNSTRE